MLNWCRWCVRRVPATGPNTLVTTVSLFVGIFVTLVKSQCTFLSRHASITENMSWDYFLWKQMDLFFFPYSHCKSCHSVFGHSPTDRTSGCPQFICCYQWSFHAHPCTLPFAHKWTFPGTGSELNLIDTDRLSSLKICTDLELREWDTSPRVRHPSTTRGTVVLSAHPKGKLHTSVLVFSLCFS